MRAGRRVVRRARLTAVATLLNDYLEAVGRPVPGPESEAGPMFARNTLVSAARV